VRPPAVSDKNESLLPNPTLDVVEENLRLFWYWIYERHTIYHKRFVLKQKPPWTKDPILREYKFTNAYRELDRVSQWVKKNIIEDKNYTILERLFTLISFKLFNKIETFEEVGLLRYNDFDPIKFEKSLKKIVDRGENPFTDAYLVNSMAYQGMKKYIAYSRHVIPFVHENMKPFYRTILTAKKPKEIIDHFSIIKGVSDFVAYELYCDIDYFDPPIMKFNQNDYVNTGPGAATGVAWIFPSRATSYKECEKVIYELRNKQKYYFKIFGFEDFPYLNNKYGKLSLREIEHSLCEFQKYMKMINNFGKRRQKFVPHTYDIL